MKKRIFIILGIFTLAASVVFLTAVFSDPFDRPPTGSLEGEYTTRTNFNPPATCAVLNGETIYDVARRLGIPFYDLVIENRLHGETPLAEGTVLKIPVYVETTDRSRSPVTIHTDATRGPAPHAAPLTSDFAFADSGLRFVWDLGNNRFSFKAKPTAFYVRPGHYRVRLVTVDGAGRYASSNTLDIDVTDLIAEYSGLPYMTVNRVGDLVDVAGRLWGPDGAAIDFDKTGKIDQSPALLEYFATNRLVARHSGFSRVRLEKDGGVFEFYLFVSPLPARLSAEPEYDWYKTQFDTGMYGNCGPAAIGSAIKWSIGKDFTVEAIRAEIGMPYSNGAVDHNNLLDNLVRHSVPSAVLPLTDAADVFGAIDRGGLVIVSFNCGAIRHTVRDKTTDFFDRYYPDATGHYLLIKGYSLDRKYFIVYDAIPGEWKANELRYLDGVSMIGRNRFFRVDEVMAGIGVRKMLVVYRDLSRPQRAAGGL
ncbi:MAG: C39 family peptidase [Spirochaetales bacterium]|nr:C39 family peptidase [Spirochaetales bacterium]